MTISSDGYEIQNLHIWLHYRDNGFSLYNESSALSRPKKGGRNAASKGREHCK